MCKKETRNNHLRMDLFFELYTDRLVSVSLGKIELKLHLTPDPSNEGIVYACCADNAHLAKPDTPANIKAEDGNKQIEIRPREQVLISASKPVFVHIDMAGHGLNNIARLDLEVTTLDGNSDVVENIDILSEESSQPETPTPL